MLRREIHLHPFITCHVTSLFHGDGGSSRCLTRQNGLGSVDCNRWVHNTIVVLYRSLVRYVCACMNVCMLYVCVMTRYGIIWNSHVNSISIVDVEFEMLNIQ